VFEGGLICVIVLFRLVDGCILLGSTYSFPRGVMSRRVAAQGNKRRLSLRCVSLQSVSPVTLCPRCCKLYPAPHSVTPKPPFLQR